MDTESFVDDGFEIGEAFDLFVGRYCDIFCAEGFVEFFLEFLLDARIVGEVISDRAGRTTIPSKI